MTTRIPLRNDWTVFEDEDSERLKLKAPLLAKDVSSPTTCFTVCPGTSFTVLLVFRSWEASARPRSRAGLPTPVHGSRCGSSTPAPVLRSALTAPILPAGRH